MPEDSNRILRSALRSAGPEAAQDSMSASANVTPAVLKPTVKDDELFEKMDKNELTLSDVVKLLLDIRDKQDCFQKQLHDLKTELLTTMDVKIKNATQKIEQDVGELKSNVENMQFALDELKSEERNAQAVPVSACDPVDDVDRTVIVINLSEDDDVSLHNRISDVMTQLECPGDSVVQVKRLEGRNGKPGLVKVAFNSKESKIEVLRAKSKLKTTQRYKRVWMRSSKTHAERLMELNFKKMLDMVPDGTNYKLTGSGRIEPRDDGNQDPRWKYRPRARYRKRWLQQRAWR